MDKLKAIVDRLVAQRVETAITELLASMNPGHDVTVSEPTAAEPRKVSIVRKTRRAGRASRVYVATARKLDSKRIKAVEKSLFPTAAICWRAVVDAKQPITASEIETVTGEKKKTVESCLFFLRQAGHVKSQPIAR